MSDETYATTLSASETVVLGVLTIAAGRRRACAVPMCNLVRTTGRCAKTVRRAIRRLIELDLLTITPQFGQDGGRDANLYTLRGQHA